MIPKQLSTTTTRGEAFDGGHGRRVRLFLS
jgi:hypothetical protein